MGGTAQLLEYNMGGGNEGQGVSIYYSEIPEAPRAGGRSVVSRRLTTDS